MISKKGLAMLKTFESFVPLEYTCVAGRRTIGYGHVVKGGESFPAGVSEAKAEELLRQDVAEAENAVADLVKVPLKQWQKDALISFAFNIGRRNFAGSTLLRVLNDGDYDKVPQELMRWVYAGGYVWKGLKLRRKREAELFVTGRVDFRPDLLLHERKNYGKLGTNL